MARSDIALTYERVGEPSITVRPYGCSVGDLFDAMVDFLRATGAGEFVLTEDAGGYRFVPEAVYYADSAPLNFDDALGVLEDALGDHAPAEDSYEDFLTASVFSVGDLVELTVNTGIRKAGDRFTIDSIDEDGAILDSNGSLYFADELRKVTDVSDVTEEPKAPTFSVGDRVALNEGFDHFYMEPGKTYRVQEVYDMPHFSVECPEFPECGAYATNLLGKFRKVTEVPTFSVGDLVEVVDDSGASAAVVGNIYRVVRVEASCIPKDGRKLLTVTGHGTVFGMFDKRFRKVTETPRDVRTGLAIPAPGFPWTKKEEPKNPFKVGDRLRNRSTKAEHGTVASLGSPRVGSSEHYAVTYTDGGWDHVEDVELVPEEPKKPTEFKQGDIVKVVRVTHPDDQKFLDSVGPVLGYDPAHTNGQTVHVSFWDHASEEDTPWWVHSDSLLLVYRPGASS